MTQFIDGSGYHAASFDIAGWRCLLIHVDRMRNAHCEVERCDWPHIGVLRMCFWSPSYSCLHMNMLVLDCDALLIAAVLL